MSIRWLAVWLIMGLAVPAQGFDEPNTFRRIPWGASVAEAKAILEKSAETMPPHLRERAKPQCGDGSVCVTQVMIGPVVAKAHLHFRAGGFVGAAFTFRTNRYAEVRAIFIEKYGGPSMAKREVVRTKGGQESVNEVLMWKGPNVVISLTRYKGNLSEGGGSVTLTRATAAHSGDRDRLLRPEGQVLAG